MKKEIARQLQNKITDCEKQFSNPNREFNTNNEIFKCSKIIPLSDSIAVVTFKKNTGKESNALFIYIKNYWIYFFPTDSHELGMWNYLIKANRERIEKQNFNKNFGDEIDLSQYM